MRIAVLAAFLMPLAVAPVLAQGYGGYDRAPRGGYADDDGDADAAPPSPRRRGFEGDIDGDRRSGRGFDRGGYDAQSGQNFDRQPREPTGRGFDDRRRAPAGPAAPVPSSGAPAAVGGGATPLYVGAQPNCNAGVVTTNPTHLNCATNPIGATSDRPGGTQLYVGTTPNRNAGIVSTGRGHLGGASRPIGYASAAGRQQLFVGTRANCNLGTVTTNPTHLNCPTSPIGATAR